eukprot:7377928-Prymnesium_polylepis.1
MKLLGSMQGRRRPARGAARAQDAPPQVPVRLRYRRGCRAEGPERQDRESKRHAERLAWHFRVARRRVAGGLRGAYRSDPNPYPYPRSCRTGCIDHKTLAHYSRWQTEQHLMEAISEADRH